MPRILFFSESCLLDRRSSAAHSVRTILHTLAGAGWQARAATLSLCNGEDEYPLGEMYPELNPAARTGTVATVTDGAVIHRVQVAHSTRHRVLRPWELRAWHKLAGTELAEFPPDVVLSYGTPLLHPLLARAQQLGARTVFYLANASHVRAAGGHGDGKNIFRRDFIDEILVPSQALATLCQKQHGIEARVLGDIVSFSLDGQRNPDLARTAARVEATFTTLLTRPIPDTLADDPEKQLALEAHRMQLAAEREAVNIRLAAGEETGAEPQDMPYRTLLQRSLAQPAMQEALVASKEQDWTRARAILEPHLHLLPEDIAALGLLAEVADAQERDVEARQLLERIILLAPGFVPARQRLVALLLKRQNDTHTALEHSLVLIERMPHQPQFIALHARLLVTARRFDEAAAIYDSFFRRYPGVTQDWMHYGYALLALSRQEEAIMTFRMAIGLNPGNGEAWQALARSGSGTFTANDITQIEKQLVREDLDTESRGHLHFALGMAHADLKAWQDSFWHYSQASDIRRDRNRHFDVGLLENYTAQIKEVFTQAFFDARSGWGEADSSPVFVIGLHAGDTALLARSLGHHFAIEHLGELPHLLRIGQDFGGAGPRGQFRNLKSALLADLDAPELACLGRLYLALCEPEKHRARPLFVDGMPINWLHLGLIHLMLPSARIVDIRRKPMAAGFALFSDSADGITRVLDQHDIARYYRTYVDLMAHFDTVLPGRIYHIEYEALAADPETELRKLLAHCGMPFEEQCLVNLPSVESAHLWRHYEEWLGPMKIALGNLAHAEDAQDLQNQPATSAPGSAVLRWFSRWWPNYRK